MSPAERVAALIRLAESTTFPAEADSARNKAAELIQKYKLNARDLIEYPSGSIHRSNPWQRRHWVIYVDPSGVASETRYSTAARRRINVAVGRKIL